MFIHLPEIRLIKLQYNIMMLQTEQSEREHQQYYVTQNARVSVWIITIIQLLQWHVWIYFNLTMRYCQQHCRAGCNKATGCPSFAFQGARGLLIPLGAWIDMHSRWCLISENGDIFPSAVIPSRSITIHVRLRV